jgi:predicted transcriptional regulator
LNDFLEDEKEQTIQAESQVVAEFKNEQEKFDQFIKDLTKILDNKTESSVNNFNVFLESLKQEAKRTQAANWEGERARVAQLFENFETKLADFLLQTEQKMILSVDLELKSARQLIDTYKVQQMNIIDENIMAMLEKTLSLVLAKNLSLKDQMDFVYECLEKAKAEKFLV